MSIFQFLLTTNFDRPEEEIVIDLVYRSNKYRLEAPIVEFGAVKVLDQRPEIEDDPNSYISAAVDRNFDYRLVPGETGFMYTRIPLAAIPGMEDVIIQPLAIPFKTYDILDQINAQLGLQLTEDDLENTEYLTMDDDFTITAKPQSKVWVGWRFVDVLGGGKKNLLFPNYMSQAFPTAPNILLDKKAQLLLIANSENHTTWNEVTDFDFGNMEGGITGAAGRNTRIYIDAHKQGYIDQWLYYKRIHPNTINDQFAGEEIPHILIPRDPFTTVQVLDKINEALNLNLTSDDVVNEAFMPGAFNYTITFKPTSLAWLPGTYNLKVQYTVGQRLRMSGPNIYRLSGGDTPRVYGSTGVVSPPPIA